jgi:hypothetical protein
MTISTTRFSLRVEVPPAEWLPARGTWAQVSLDAADDAKGDFPPAFPATRDLVSLFTDFTGAVWNPHVGALGAWLLHGGGHQQYLGNEVYAWSADTRRWARLSDPTYPGEVPLSDWEAYTEPPFASPLLDERAELATGVPASSHSRWHPSILPPAAGGGPQGSLLVPFASAIHTSGNGTCGQGHRFDCASRTWSRLGDPNPVISGGQCWSSCVDASRAAVFTFGNSAVSRLDVASGAFAEVDLPGYYGSGFEKVPAAHALEHDVIVLLDSAYGIRVIDAASPTALVAPTVTGAAPAATEDQSYGLTWCPDLPPHGALVCLDYATLAVMACFAPEDPGAGTWAWQELVATNRPAFGQSGLFYNWFQYAPALRAFFHAGGAHDGMWCFRPTEIP